MVYPWISLDTLCISIKYIHCISMDIHGISLMYIHGIYVVHCGISMDIPSFLKLDFAPARADGLIQCVHACG
jgi:hypothetical protein